MNYVDEAPREDPRRGPRRERGLTILELTVAASLLSVFLCASVQVMAALEVGRRAAERRAMALRALDNVMEEIASMPWAQLSNEKMNQVRLPEQVSTRLPGAELTIDVHEVVDEMVARRVSAGITWQSPGGRGAGSLRLVTWVFAPDEDNS